MISTIGSPTKRTSSTASGYIGDMNSSAPTNIDGYIEPTTLSLRSAPVNTATTPSALARRRHVDPDLRPGDVAAHEVGVQHAREGDVVGVATASGEQAGVFLAEHRLADVPAGRRVCDGVAHADVNPS